MTQRSQFTLLRKQRFLPFFLTQFAGAFNDNLYKNALLLLITFSAGPVMGLSSNVVVNVAAGLFILPFFLFSALAGQVADKFEKSAIIRWVKLAEIIIMSLAALALWHRWYAALLLLLFVMGAQSTFFGPVKYSILPQALEDQELVGGNALVEMGTFVAILVGTLGAGLIMQLPAARLWAAGGVILAAVLGYLASRRIPPAQAADPVIRLNFNPLTETWRVIDISRENNAVFLSIMAISWFWFLGAGYLTQFPNFAHEALAGDKSVVTLLLAVFTIGIGVGSMLCERMSGHRVELGIVPIGSLGLSLFGIDLYLSVPLQAGAGSIDWLTMLTDPDYLRVVIDLLGIGIFGGFFIVPLYAYIQQETAPARRARIIAANNILNALFMVVSAIAGALLLGPFELTIPQFFLVLALMNLVIAAYVYRQVPEFALRFIIWSLSHTIYRVRHQGMEWIPESGAAVLVCNHVSYMDALVIAGAVKRPVRFVMDDRIFASRLLGWFFRLAKAIPIAPRSKNPVVYDAAFAAIEGELAAGNLVCIFPEGKLTTDGQVDRFRGGIETIIARCPVPVVPMALQGLWGSFFSHCGGPAFSHWPRRFWSRVGLMVGRPLAPSAATATVLESSVRSLRGELA